MKKISLINTLKKTFKKKNTNKKKNKKKAANQTKVNAAGRSKKAKVLIKKKTKSNIKISKSNIKSKSIKQEKNNSKIAQVHFITLSVCIYNRISRDCTQQSVSTVYNGTERNLIL